MRREEQAEGLSPAQLERRARVRARWSPPPGPLPRGAQGDAQLLPRDGETLDHLNGEWRIFQRRGGHRYSTDDLLTAWYGCHHAAEAGLEVSRYLDLGAGIGSVTMIATWKLLAQGGHPQVVAIEAQAQSAALFARSQRYNGIEARVELRRGDLRDPALLPERRCFELVTGSPPYLATGDAVISEDAQRDQCRFERRGGVEGYLETASRALTEHGICALVHQHAAQQRIREAAVEFGLQLWRTRRIEFRAGKPPLIAVYALRRAEVAGDWQDEPPLVTRDAAGQRSAEYQRVRAWMGFPP